MTIQITPEQFESVFKPQFNHFKPVEQLDTEDNTEWRYDVIGDEGDYVREFYKTNPDRVWTVLEVDGETVTASGLQLVNREAYIITEVPFTDDVESKEPVTIKTVSILIETNEYAESSDVDAFLDEVFDNVHDEQYTVSRTCEITEIESFNAELGFELGIDRSNDPIFGQKMFKAEMEIALFKDDSISDVAFKEIIREAINNHEADLIFQYVLTVKEQVEPVKALMHCPKCLSDDISSSNYEGTDSGVECKVTCDSCGHEWEEFYTISEIDTNLN